MLAPVMAKYQVIPAWLVPFMDEFRLGVWIAGVAWKSYDVIATAKREEAERKARGERLVDGKPAAA